MTKKKNKKDKVVIRKKIWKKQEENSDNDINDNFNEQNINNNLDKKNKKIARLKEKLQAKSEERKELNEIKNKEFDEVEKTIEVNINESASEKLKNAMEAQNPKKKKKSMILNLCLLAVNIVFMVFIVKNMLTSLDGNILDVFKMQGSKLWWLVGDIIAYLVFIFVQVLSYKILINSLAKNNSTALAYDTAIVGRYYDNVTPMAVGGQPMQIVVLANHNVNATVATGLPLIKLMINTAISSILSLVFFIFGFPMFQTSTPLNGILVLLLEIFGIIGLIISLIIAVLIFLVSSGKLITKSFVSFVLRLGYKMKFVKNYRKSYRKLMSQVEEYKFSMQYLLSNKKILFKLLTLNLIENLVYALMPYFVVMAFISEMSVSPLSLLFLCVAKYYLCTMASSFIPLPGGTGMMEISFIVLFGMTVGNNVVWALLGWRFFSYYLILIHGFIHELIKIFKNISKNKKDKIKRENENILNKENKNATLIGG